MNADSADPGIEARLADEFPSRDQSRYFNHAAMGPWPRCVAQAVSDFAQENLLHGPARYRDWIGREQQLRKQLAALINAPSVDDIALLKNTTEGISAVAWGLSWADGDNLVLPADEFSSNRLPWLAQRSRGVEVREIDIRAAEDAEGALIAAVDERTRLLAVSAVQWSDGFRLDLQRLGVACRERGVLFFVDAIQQLGALRLDVSACHIDFLAADAHKWLLGPEGIAVFFSTAPARPELELLQQGWHMYDNPWGFSRNEWSPAKSAKRFEAGSPNSVGQAALNAGLDLLDSVGGGVIERRVLANTGWLIEHLSALEGLEIVSRTEPHRRSGIVTFRPRTGSAAKLHRYLHESGYGCSLRAQAIRLSPHYYQDATHLAPLISAVKRGLEEILGAD